MCSNIFVCVALNSRTYAGSSLSVSGSSSAASGGNGVETLCWKARYGLGDSGVGERLNTEGVDVQYTRLPRTTQQSERALSQRKVRMEKDALPFLRFLFTGILDPSNISPLTFRRCPQHVLHLLFHHRNTERPDVLGILAKTAFQCRGEWSLENLILPRGMFGA